MTNVSFAREHVQNKPLNKQQFLYIVQSRSNVLCCHVRTLKLERQQWTRTVSNWNNKIYIIFTKFICKRKEHRTSTRRQYERERWLCVKVLVPKPDNLHHREGENGLLQAVNNFYTHGASSVVCVLTSTTPHASKWRNVNRGAEGGGRKYGTKN